MHIHYSCQLHLSYVAHGQLCVDKVWVSQKHYSTKIIFRPFSFNRIKMILVIRCFWETQPRVLCHALLSILMYKHVVISYLAHLTYSVHHFQ
jgi:hypothetical protein